MSEELKPTLGALTEQEREQVESQLHWVACPHCKGDAVNYTGGKFCEVCGNSGRVLQSTANVLTSFLPFYVAAEARVYNSIRERLYGNAHAASLIAIMDQLEAESRASIGQEHSSEVDYCGGMRPMRDHLKETPHE